MVTKPEIVDNLSLVINNVGLFPKGRSLQANPVDMEAAIKVNLYPIVLLSKLARNSFQKQHEKDILSGS
jgi:short-subunit dehydrogenase